MCVCVLGQTVIYSCVLKWLNNGSETQVRQEGPNLAALLQQDGAQVVVHITSIFGKLVSLASKINNGKQC